MVDITILGTGSMLPTKERNVQAFYLEFDGEGMLIDCGEGTQRQMSMAGISRAKVRKILITHWHGDHVAGLIGLIQTIGNSNYEGTLHIYGPLETKEKMFHIMNATIFENKVDIDVHELNPKAGQEHVFIDTEKYKVSCALMDHGVPCLGYSWYEKDRTRVDMATCAKLGIKEGPMVGKLSSGHPVVVNGQTVKPEDVTYRVAGKKVTFIPDTQFSQNLAMLARHADLLVCEATYVAREEEKSRDVKHMTAEHAAHVATAGEVKRLVLTHFSQRYTTAHQHVDEARAIFPKTDAAFDLMKITF